jgi:hypothetical protein
MLDYLDSEDGQKALEEWAVKINNEKAVRQSQLNRFHDKYANSIGEIFYKIRIKYESNKYIYRWLDRGIEPPQSLFWFLFDYAEKYGREATSEEYIEHGNMFTSMMYYIDGYFFRRMDGQGSVIDIFLK